MKSVTKNVERFRIYLCFLAVLCSCGAFAQKEAANWYFGINAGLSFNTSPPTPLLDGQLVTKEGCATISTGDGALQFYSDGTTVYNRNHGVMMNGTDLLGHNSSTQSAMIVPAPGNINKYYIFTVPAEAGNAGFNYSVVDMTLDGGLGGVTSEKNIRLDNPNLVAEKVTAVRHADGESIWVISHRMDSNRFIAFLVSPSGLNPTPVISATGSFVGIGGSSAIGYLKASPDGKKLASAKQNVVTDFELFDFNNATGVVSNPMKLSSTDAGYGVEFSPDSKRVYFTTFSNDIFQYDITPGTLEAIKATRTVIAAGGQYVSLQVALDGKIYVTKNGSGRTSLAVINSPNNLGAACNFQDIGVTLGGRNSDLGLPPFIQSFFKQDIEVENLCVQTPTNLSVTINANIVSAQWNFGDGTTSADINATHTYALPGTYTVEVDFFIDANSTVIHLSKDITILPVPVANQPAEMVACTTGGPTTFDLTQQTTSILNGQSAIDFAVTYYASQEDLDNDTAVTSITHSLDSQTIIAKVTNTFTGCFSFTEFETIRNASPVIDGKENLKACGIGSTALFDLTANTPLILGNQDPAVFDVKYYTTSALADAGTTGTEITTPETYTSGDTTIYARIFNSTATDCYQTTSITLTTTQNQIINPAGNPFYYTVCATQGSNTAPVTIAGIASNLTNQALQPLALFDPAVTQDTDLANYTITYHLLQADAVTGDNAIADGYSATNGQIIYIRVSYNLAQSCVAVGQVRFNVVSPQANTPTPLVECSDSLTGATFNLLLKNDEISLNPAYTISYYDNQADALSGTTAPVSSTAFEGIDNQIVYTRVEDTLTGCATVVELLLRVIPAPIATTPAPIAECDDNNDGFARFNLVPTMQAIEAAIADVTVSAFETQSDADLNVNAIPSPQAYDNIVVGTQTLYLRVQSDLTDCYDTLTLVLIVNPRPDAHSPAQPYALCDDGTSDSDGIAHFNLNSQSAEILAGLDPAQYTVDYYTDAAATPASLIGTPGNYPSATAIVYAKVTNTATGCFYIVPVRLVVNALPVLITNEYSYSLCDTTLPANKETFDLTTTIDNFITDENLNGVKVSFHTTLADAQGNTNALTDQQTQAYENTSQVQSLYVRFTVTTTGCFRLGYLDIRVEPQPVLTLPSQDDLTVCDTDGNGIGEFNLEALKEVLANGDASLVITFHLTAEEALSGANPIGNTTDYRNDHPGTQTLWVRAVSGTTGCFNTTPFPVTLIVTPAPQAPKLQDITLCDDTDNNGQDGALRTDLTVYETQIKEAVAPVEVTITYYLSKADADAGSNGIASPARHIARDGQVIWVRVENTAGCYSLTSFTIHINKPHQLVTPTPLAVCNEALPNDGIAEFDLTQKDDEILGPDGVGMDYVVDYFTTDPKTDSTAVAIADPKAYVNTDSNGAAQNPRTIWVRVTTTQGCVSYTTLTIRVLPLPVPNFNPAPLEVCDQDTTEVGSEPFDLTLAQDDIRNNGTNYLFSYYTTEEDAQAGTNAIPDPTSHNSASGSVWVRVEANTNNPSDLRCFQIVELELIVNPLPPIADLADYGICNDTPASPTAFNLKEYVETALGGNTGTIYTIGYFSDAALTTRATPITGYVVTGSATVYIEVVNNDTGCRIVKELSLS
ncbi:hypothetical protein AMR72_08535 [Flavobacterium psychrophilum]|nr:hypothetical protein AMR72_08535 [Flavobacterium psychrophilum]AOE52546.1 hypothetical protein ALW18_08525 [Flavobacterium psychrophilum]